MRLLLDENSSDNRLRDELIRVGHDVETVAAALRPGTADAAIIGYAVQSKRILITQDQDDFRPHYSLLDSHPGLIVIYPGPKSLDIARLVTAFGNLFATYADTTDMVLALNDFFW